MGTHTCSERQRVCWAKTVRAVATTGQIRHPPRTDCTNTRLLGTVSQELINVSGIGNICQVTCVLVLCRAIAVPCISGRVTNTARTFMVTRRFMIPAHSGSVPSVEWED